MSFNNTLQSVSNFCSTHSDLLPLSGVGGYANEPFLSIANDAISDLLSSPSDWKINRAEMPLLVTCPNKQDYLFAGAVAFSLGSTCQGWAIDLASKNAITVSGGVVTVTTIESHRFAVGDVVYLNNVVAATGNAATVSLYNGVFTDNGSSSVWSNGFTITAVTSTSFSFASVAGMSSTDVLGAPGITDFGWLTSGSMVMMINQSSPQYSEGLTAYREQPVTSRIANPVNVAVISDLNTGVIKVRFYLVPGSVTWGAKLVYQKKAPVKQSLGDDWSPFPDNYSALYRQAVIYRMYRWLDSPKADNEFKKLEVEIAKIQGSDDAEETSVSLQPEEPIMSLDNAWYGW